MSDEQRSIGWWVRRLDTLLEEAVDAAVSAEGLTRRHWQVLHSLAEGEVSEAAVLDALRDFPGDVGAVDDPGAEPHGREHGAGTGVRLSAAPDPLARVGS